MKLQVGVKLVIKNSRGLYLFVQRSQPLSDGADWDIPGGRINTSERLEEALARELKEEIGVELDTKIELVKAQDIILPNADLHVVRITYITEFDKTIKLSEEHRDFKWVSLSEALNLNLDPYLRELMETL
jgi:8-oxo-dGTP diphosphatase